MPGQKCFIRLGPNLIVLLQVSKCNFLSFGPSGTITSLDLLCVLPMNQFVQKIVVLTWFW